MDPAGTPLVPPRRPWRGRRAGLVGLLALLGLAAGLGMLGSGLAPPAARGRWDGALVLPAAPAVQAWPQFGGSATHQGAQAAGAPLQGRLAWTVHTGGPLISSPVVGAGIVYAGSSDGFLYAVQARDGAVLWRAPLGPKLLNTTPVLAGGLLLVAADYTWMTALDSRTGQSIWRADQGDAILAPPAADGEAGLGLVASGASLLALDLRDGRRRWELQISDSRTPGWPSVGAPAVAAGMVFWAPGVGSQLLALDEATGATRWRFDAADRLAASPVLGDGRLYLATWRGLVVALDAATGGSQWQHTLGHGQPGEGSEATPALSANRLFAGTYQGTLYALDARSGADLWQFQAAGPIVASPVASGSVVYCAAEDGNLYMVDAATGALR